MTRRQRRLKTVARRIERKRRKESIFSVSHVSDDAKIEEEVEEDECSKRDKTVVAKKGEDECKG